MAENALLYVGFVLAAAASVRLYTKDLDDDLSKEAREALALRLMCLEDRDTSFVDWVNRSFDVVFGEEHLSLRCFLVSSAISAVCFTVFFLWGASIRPDFNFTATVFTGLPILTLGVGILLNVPSDYIALLETRWIMRSRLSTTMKILADLALTYLVSLGWLAFLLSLVLGPKVGLMTFVAVLIDPLALGAAIDHSSATESGAAVVAAVFLDVLVFYVFLSRVVLGTSYVTSLWVWVYGVSDLFLRFLARHRRVVEHLNVEEKPARALGLATSIFVLILGAAAYPLLLVAVA